jgi:POT family proton-dependent oligopeptide transporter
VVLTCSEVLVSITSLEFSYKQAPLRMKSIVMALYLLSISAGNATTAVVNEKMVRELPGSRVTVGAETWVSLPPGTAFVSGQKIDFGGETGITVVGPGSEGQPLEGTFLAAEVRGSSIRLMDNEHRRPVVTTGSWNAAAGQVSTYRLVGPQYFNFFAGSLTAMGLVFIGVAFLYRERHYVRGD